MVVDSESLRKFRFDLDLGFLSDLVRLRSSFVLIDLTIVTAFAQPNTGRLMRCDAT